MINSGYIDMGYVKTTPFQKKKHITQMNKKEETYLRNCLDNMAYRLEFSKHLKDKKRRNNISFSKTSISNMLIFGEYDIIEYNETWIDNHTELSRRVLIRGTNAEDVQIFRDGSLQYMSCNLCVVIDFERGKIVTAYWNAVDDDHETLNPNRYDKNLRIIKR